MDFCVVIVHYFDLFCGFVEKLVWKGLTATCCVCVPSWDLHTCLSFQSSQISDIPRAKINTYVFFQYLCFLLSIQSVKSPLKLVTIVRISHLAMQWIMVLIPGLRFNYQPNLPDNYVGSAHRSIEVGGPKRRPTRLGTSQRTHACGSSGTARLHICVVTATWNPTSVLLGQVMCE